MDIDKMRKERARLLQTITRLNRKENYEVACNECEELIALSQDIAEQSGMDMDLLSLAMAYKLSGQMYMLYDKPEQSLPFFEKALDVLKQAEALDGIERQQILLLLGLASRDCQDLEKAYRCLHKSLAECEGILDRDPSAANYEKKLVVLDFLLEMAGKEERRALEAVRHRTLQNYYSLPGVKF